MVSKELVIGIAVVLAAFAIMSVNAKKEGWRPFAWYGYPGYQARGDWTGVDPATRRVDKPLPLIAPRRSTC